jgi:cytochrome-b5 reductase
MATIMNRTSGPEFTTLHAVVITSFLAAMGIYSYYKTNDELQQPVIALTPKPKSNSSTIVNVKNVDIPMIEPRKQLCIPGSTKARLTNKSQVSPDTVMLTFEFIGEGKIVPVGKHIKIFAPNPNHTTSTHWNGEVDAEAGKEIIERKYTPVSSSDSGFVLVIKAYKPNDVFKDGGKMSQYLAGLNLGDDVDVALPFGIMEYLKCGQFKKSKQIVHVDSVGMVAGGSGITPMLRLIEAALDDPEDTTKFSLIFANRSECDILLRKKLDHLASTHSDRFKVAYTLTRPPEEWNGEVGLVSKEMLRKHMPPNSPNTLVLLCGPPKMIKNCCKNNLESLGYSSQLTWDF